MILSKIFELLGSPKPIKITFKNFLNKISLLNLSKNTTNNFIDNGSIKEDYRKTGFHFLIINSFITFILLTLI